MRAAHQSVCGLQTTKSIKSWELGGCSWNRRQRASLVLYLDRLFFCHSDNQSTSFQPNHLIYLELDLKYFVNLVNKYKQPMRLINSDLAIQIVPCRVSQRLAYAICQTASVKLKWLVHPVTGQLKIDSTKLEVKISFFASLLWVLRNTRAPSISALYLSPCCRIVKRFYFVTDSLCWPLL